MEEIERENEATPGKLDFSARSKAGENRDTGYGNRQHPGRGDRAIKLRLLSLLGLLLLVIVAMKEAGKPERWMWLGFDRPPIKALLSETEIAPDAILLNAHPVNSDSVNTPQPQAGNLGHMSKLIASQLLQSDGGVPNRKLSNEPAQQNPVADPDPQQTPVAIDFWQSTFVMLEQSQREAFYQLLRRIDASQLAPPKDDLPFESAIESLIQQNNKNQTKILGAIAVMSDGDRKLELTEDLFAFDHSWQQDVLPALKSSANGTDFTIASQTAVRSIRSIIDPLVMREVEDLTGIGNPRDKLAWLAIWDSVLRDARVKMPMPMPAQTQTNPNTNNPGAPPPVVERALLQFKGQPQAFRGQRVKVSGTALTIRKKTLTNTKLKLDEYYEVWVDPLEGHNDGLICVYVATLPASFATSAVKVIEKFSSISVPVSIDGRFFKIRSYQDASKSVSHCPVVIAETWTANSQGRPPSTASPWHPSLAAVMMFFIVAGFAAIAIAYVVFRSTKSGSEIANKPTSKRVARALGALANDASVMTDTQRISQLNDRLEEDFS